MTWSEAYTTQRPRLQRLSEQGSWLKDNPDRVRHLVILLRLLLFSTKVIPYAVELGAVSALPVPLVNATGFTRQSFMHPNMLGIEKLTWRNREDTRP